ncbi:MAG: hypothetical protein UR65_C0068G0001, partial [Candidatus Moranbacteria bacterium GW2011_GWE2_35_164]
MEGNNFSKFESGVKVNVNSNVGHVDKT